MLDSDVKRLSKGQVLVLLYDRMCDRMCDKDRESRRYMRTARKKNKVNVRQIMSFERRCNFVVVKGRLRGRGSIGAEKGELF